MRTLHWDGPTALRKVTGRAALTEAETGRIERLGDQLDRTRLTPRRNRPPASARRAARSRSHELPDGHDVTGTQDTGHGTRRHGAME